jgi:hypothetical protein
LALRRQFPQLQLVVVGTETLQQQIAGQLGDGTVFRFAARPTSAERLKSLLFAALRERERNLADPEFAMAGFERQRGQPTRARRRRWAWGLALALIATVATVAGWFASAYLSGHLLP